MLLQELDDVNYLVQSDLGARDSCFAAFDKRVKRKSVKVVVRVDSIENGRPSCME